MVSGLPDVKCGSKLTSRREQKAYWETKRKWIRRKKREFSFSYKCIFEIHFDCFYGNLKNLRQPRGLLSRI